MSTNIPRLLQTWQRWPFPNFANTVSHSGRTLPSHTKFFFTKDLGDIGKFSLSCSSLKSCSTALSLPNQHWRISAALIITVTCILALRKRKTFWKWFLKSCELCSGGRRRDCQFIQQDGKWRKDRKENFRNAICLCVHPLFGSVTQKSSKLFLY